MLSVSFGQRATPLSQGGVLVVPLSLSPQLIGPGRTTVNPSQANGLCPEDTNLGPKSSVLGCGWWGQPCDLCCRDVGQERGIGGGVRGEKGGGGAGENCQSLLSTLREAQHLCLFLDP